MVKVNQTQKERSAQKKVREDKSKYHGPRVLRVNDAALNKSRNGFRQVAAARIFKNVLPKKLTSEEKRRKAKISLSEPINGKSSFSISCGDLETMKVETVLYHIRNWANIDSGTFQTILSCDDKRLGDTYYVVQYAGLRELLQKKKKLKCTIVPRQMQYVSLSDESDTDFTYETSDDEGWV
jgi:hypothetical protein